MGKKRRFCKEKVRISYEKSEVRLRIFSLEVLKHKGLAESFTSACASLVPGVAHTMLHCVRSRSQQVPNTMQLQGSFQASLLQQKLPRRCVLLASAFLQGCPAGRASPSQMGLLGKGKCSCEHCCSFCKLQCFIRIPSKYLLPCRLRALFSGLITGSSREIG